MIYNKRNAFQAHIKLSCLFLYEKDYLNGCRSTFSNKSRKTRKNFACEPLRRNHLSILAIDCVHKSHLKTKYFTVVACETQTLR